MDKIHNTQIIFMNLLNVRNFKICLSKEKDAFRKETQKISAAYSIWLKCALENISSGINENKMLLRFKSFNIIDQDQPQFSFPQVKQLQHSFNYTDIVSQLSNKKERALRKKRFFSSTEKILIKKEAKFDKETDNPHEKKMDVIFEQPSREEKDGYGSNAFIDDIKSVASEKEQLRNLQTVSKIHVGSKIKDKSKIKVITPSFNSIKSVINKEEDKNNDPDYSSKTTYKTVTKVEGFTFAKEKPKPKIISAGKKISNIKPITSSIAKFKEVPFVNDEWPNPFKNIKSTQSTTTTTNPNLTPTGASISPLIIEPKEEEIEYSITDNSDSSDDNEFIGPKKEIAPWARDKKKIQAQVFRQNATNEYNIIFGKCKVDHLNLNMIFYTNTHDYDVRNSTADWRLDNTAKSVVHYDCQNQSGVEDVDFTQTNRQLNFQ